MNDGAARSLRLPAERIRRRVDSVLGDLTSAATAIRGALDPVGRPLRRAELDRVRPMLLGVLEGNGDFVQGVGLALDDGHLADEPRWMEWWRRDGDEPPRFVRHHLDPDHPYFYDYPAKDWCSAPRDGRQPAVTGPFVDFAGTNEHTVTLAVPVEHEDGFVDVLGADAAVGGVERLLIDAVGAGPPATVLVNDHDRVVASTDARWWSGTLLPADVDSAEEVELGGDVRWRLVRLQD